jgi:hypothetical protein
MLWVCWPITVCRLHQPANNSRQPWHTDKTDKCRVGDSIMADQYIRGHTVPKSGRFLTYTLHGLTARLDISQHWKDNLNINHHNRLICILYSQRDATYTVFCIIISALHVSGGISAHHQELTKLYVQSWVLPCCLPLVWMTHPHQR